MAIIKLRQNGSYINLGQYLNINFQSEPILALPLGGHRLVPGLIQMD